MDEMSGLSCFYGLTNVLQCITICGTNSWDEIMRPDETGIINKMMKFSDAKIKCEQDVLEINTPETRYRWAPGIGFYPSYVDSKMQFSRNEVQSIIDASLRLRIL